MSQHAPKREDSIITKLMLCFFLSRPFSKTLKTFGRRRRRCLLAVRLAAERPVALNACTRDIHLSSISLLNSWLGTFLLVVVGIGICVRRLAAVTSS